MNTPSVINLDNACGITTVLVMYIKYFKAYQNTMGFNPKCISLQVIQEKKTQTGYCRKQTY